MSPAGRVIIGVCGAFGLVSLAFAVILSTALHVSASGLIAFAGWCSAIGLFTYCWPKVWSSRVEYVITDRHVIWRRGPIRRSIDRDSISYARIRWNAGAPGSGDLVLVRAVPTGALRRTLSLTLSDVDGPDRIWAMVRGVTPSAPLGDGERPLPQRLDEGERVLWSGTPLLAPWTVRRAGTAALAVVVGLGAVRAVGKAIPTLRRIVHLHALPGWSLVLLVVAVTVSVLLVAVVAGSVAYMACWRPRQLARATRYLVTNQRVLIRRGREELSLDRTRIADVISTPTPTRLGPTVLVDLFLVLDGPQARAFASSGAFQGEGEQETLLPVLHAIEDGETVGAILRHVSTETLATAA